MPYTLLRDLCCAPASAVATAIADVKVGTRMNKRKQEGAIADGSVFVPAVAMLFVAPFAMSELIDWRTPFGPSPYYPFLPFWIGLLCVPGYLSAWHHLKRSASARGLRRGWQIASVAVALACSLVGAVYSAFTIFGGVLATWSGVVVLLLLVRLLFPTMRRREVVE